jgi:hypothetical protein
VPTRYSGLGNIKPANVVVEEIWRLMDTGEEKCWDWEAVMKEMVRLSARRIACSAD